MNKRATNHEANNGRPGASADYHDLHRQRYEMRLQREADNDIEITGETGIRSLKADEDRQMDQLSNGSVESADVRLPMQTGYTDRLIDDEQEESRAGFLARVWRGREPNDRLLPLVAGRDPDDESSRCSRCKKAIGSFFQHYWRILLLMLIVTLTFLTIIET